ncbi:Uncharacterised protein [Klebsiella pneumoniae]|nr:hypothetical protein AI2607V1_1434 [Klebsiella pneumoniae]CAH3511122.1 hypothetical protein AI2607V1_1434 [Klebsiella pneumoniae]SXQ04021.1 Uncharacterised protein [Klebsiella pneumoniae]
MGLNHSFFNRLSYCFNLLKARRCIEVSYDDNGIFRIVALDAIIRIRQITDCAFLPFFCQKGKVVLPSMQGA